MNQLSDPVGGENTFAVVVRIWPTHRSIRRPLAPVGRCHIFVLIGCLFVFVTAACTARERGVEDLFFIEEQMGHKCVA